MMTQMNNLDALADQIYQEGIEKANRESEKIVEEARQKAAGMIEEAEAEASNILNEAQANANRLESRTQNEIQVKSKQALSDLRVAIEQLLLSSSLDDPIKHLFQKEDFLKALILKVTEQWGASDEYTISIPEDTHKDIRNFLSGHLNKELSSLTIKPSSDVRNGFTVKNTGEGYYISFTEEDFIEFLKPYFSDQLKQLLFH